MFARTLRRTAATRAPLAIAFLLFIAVALPTSILNVAWQYIHADLDQPYDALGILLLFFTAGRILSTFFAGRVLARVGMWRSVFTGMSILMVGLLGVVVSPSWPVLLVSMLALAYGWGLMDIGVNLYVAALPRQGILNFLHASFGIGLTLGPLIATLVVVRLGQNWRLSYLAPLGLMLGLWLWTFVSRAQWVLPSGVGAAAKQTSETQATAAAMLAQAENALPFDASVAPQPSPGAPIRATLALPVMGPWLLFALLYAGFEVGTGQLSGDLLTKSRGLDAETASTWISLYWAAFTGGRFLSGFIAGRFSERTLLLSFTCAAAVGAVMLALPGLGLALPGLLLIGLSLAGIFPTLISLVPRRFGLNHAPNVIGFTLASANAGIAILPGFMAAFAVRVGFEIVGICLVAVAVAQIVSYLLILRRTRGEAPVSAAAPAPVR